MDDYPILVREFDNTYGDPRESQPQKKKGSHALRYIIKFLSLHKRSTCEQIAEHEYRQRPKSKVKPKSITDDVRKFIKNNLVPKKLVVEDGTVKSVNKQIQLYSLTPFGILYSIHLFNDYSHVLNLATEYKDTLPMVFGKLDHLKKHLEKYFPDILGIRGLSHRGIEQETQSSHSEILNAFVSHDYYYRIEPHNEVADTDDDVLIKESKRFKAEALSPHIVADQISYAVYNNILQKLPDYVMMSDGRFRSMANRDSQTTPIIENGEVVGAKIEKTKGIRSYSRNTYIKKMKEHRDGALDLWIDMINSDPEIKTWYGGFVKRALSAHVERRQKLLEIVTLFKK